MDGQNIHRGIWQERAAKVFLAVAALSAAYLLFERVLRLLMPFLLAALLAALIRPCAAFAEKKWKVPRRFGGIVLLLLLIVLLSVLITAAARRLILEVQRLTEYIGSGGELLGARVEQALEVLTGLTEHLPFLSHLKARKSLESFWMQVDAKLAEIISDTLARWSAKIPELIGAFVRSVPSAIIFFLTFLIAAFYLCADLEGIAASLASYLPHSVRHHFFDGKAKLTRLGGRYLHAYFLLFLLTFAQLFIGFSVLGLSYTFLPALLIALVDILPVLGVGMVLVPWGIVELLRGNVALGTGLLILCGIMLLIRQFTEPRIVGGSLGLHPLATLLAAYVGLELFGLLGVLFGPAVALVVKNILKKEECERGAS
ncbi:MAG: sporulation integral membrane protein YtvI [Clostridia bacterium]|nr:sporulation integral membrane protein YtvI [Clostridia bacterium]